ncbi:MFS transporter [Microbacterium caowuchunii]|uniref:MFS transporter n=1 Tax=Microbacterium caowuchunii TaxID=2614638 RepID=UPI0012462B7F|nr:MFS transporter [Microbacterium caowuchunii]QEV99180.1 MFS transporter [Microbacterium caowuchunii]
MHTAAPSASPPSDRLPLRALLLLAVGVLVTVTAEALPAGLMPEMAADLSVSPEQIGTLISIWAATVILTSLPLSTALARLDRRAVVGVALAVFAVANMVSGLVPDYSLVIVARLAGAVAHGVFWSVVMVYASSLLAPAHLGRGLAIVSAGGSAASAAALPAATLLAQMFGWRSAFLVLGAVALVLSILIIGTMPASHAVREARGPGRRRIWRDRTFLPVLVLGLSMGVLAAAQYASFTYIRPYLAAAGIAAEWAPALLLSYGVAGLGGVVLAALVADRFPRASLAALLAGFGAAFAVLCLPGGGTSVMIAALILWGVSNGALFPLVQTILMRVASERTKPFAGAGVVVLFNMGIAVGPVAGALVGGADAPSGVTALSAGAVVIAGLLAAVGVVMALRRDRPVGSVPGLRREETSLSA